MLSCRVGVTNVNVIDYKEKQLRSWSNRGLLKCPVCGEKLVYKHGLVRIPHFSHEKDKECTYTYFENETKEHHLGKVLLYKWLQKLEFVENLELESYIKETKQRPDLYFELFGQRYVIEYQCSPITVEEYLERSELYKLNDIIDIWVLGTENFNFKPSGKLKMKALDELLFIKNRLYYLNSFNEMIYKIVAPTGYVDGYYKFRKHNVTDLNNFYIEKDKIIINEMVSVDFTLKLNRFVKKIKTVSEKLLAKQYKAYDEVINKIREEQQSELETVLTEILKNKTIYLYSDWNILNKNKSVSRFYYITYKGRTISGEWLLKDIFNNYNKLTSDNEIHIFLPKWDIWSIRKPIKSWFPNNKLIYVDYNNKEMK